MIAETTSAGWRDLVLAAAEMAFAAAKPPLPDPESASEIRMSTCPKCGAFTAGGGLCPLCAMDEYAPPLAPERRKHDHRHT